MPQIIQKLGTSRNILIIAQGGHSPDSLAAGIAFKTFLDKLDKRVTLAVPGFQEQRFDFLPGVSQVEKDFKVTKNFIIEVSTARTELAELSYEKENNHLLIYLKPKEGEFEPGEVKLRNSDYPYDCMVVLGASTLEQLGSLYSENASLFFETPIINIDYRANNENFGQINLINLTASSVSEVVFDLISAHEHSLIDETTATLLLAGIVSETNSFQHTKTTPQAFLKASQLVNMGARQQEIVQQLYRNKSLGFLRLWGRVLARLKQETELSLVHSTINQSDIEKSEASESDVNTVIGEMVSQLSFAKWFLFIREKDGVSECHLASAGLNLHDLFSIYKPESLGVHAVKIQINQPSSLTLNEILDKIKSRFQAT